MRLTVEAYNFSRVDRNPRACNLLFRFFDYNAGNPANVNWSFRSIVIKIKSYQPTVRILFGARRFCFLILWGNMAVETSRSVVI